MASKAKRVCRFCGVAVVPGLLVCGRCSLERERRKAEGEQQAAGWAAADKAKAAGPQLLAALQVLVLTPETRRWLQAHDPKALEQARRAVVAAGGQCDPVPVPAEEQADEAARCPVCGEYLGDYGTCATVGCGGGADDGRDNGAPWRDDRDSGDREADEAQERSREGLCEHGIALGSGYCPACYPGQE